MKLFVSVFFLLVYLNSSSQVGPIRNWVDAEVKLTDSKGNTALVTNSLPKGGGVVNKNGKKYGYVVFWTRVFNQSAAPIELTIKFPEITYFKSPGSYIKIVLPKETMHLGRVQLYDYGLTNLQSLFNIETNQISVLKKTINPKEEYLFYVTVFIHLGQYGAVRAKFELKDQDLFYKISMGADTILIPCGSLDFKN